MVPGETSLSYRVEIEQEDDGRWIAEVVELPGVLAYGRNADEALANAQALALRVLADRLEHGEVQRGPLSLTFETSIGS
jgi:predicted RNase H-like HicB family nuclease